jgi:hypothetical protein
MKSVNDLFNGCVGVQDGTNIRLRFETVEDADQAFEYIGALGDKPTDQQSAAVSSPRRGFDFKCECGAANWNRYECGACGKDPHKPANQQPADQPTAARYSCRCPARRGEPCPLSDEECLARATDQQFAASLSAAQKPMDPDAAKVLYESRDELYIAADQQTGGAS